MTDFSRTERNPISLQHFYWLGFKNINGALVKDGFDGEIQFTNNSWWFCQNNTAVKEIIINKDIDDIYLKQKYSY